MEYVFLVVGIVSAASLTLGVAFSGVAAMLYIVNRGRTDSEELLTSFAVSKH